MSSDIFPHSTYKTNHGGDIIFLKGTYDLLSIDFLNIHPHKHTLLELPIFFFQVDSENNNNSIPYQYLFRNSVLAHFILSFESNPEKSSHNFLLSTAFIHKVNHYLMTNLIWIHKLIPVIQNPIFNICQAKQNQFNQFILSSSKCERLYI